MVQFLKDIIVRVGEMSYCNPTARGRRRGSVVSWMGGEASRGLCRCLEGQAKVFGGLGSVYKV